MLKFFWSLCLTLTLTAGFISITGCGGPPAEEPAPADPDQGDLDEMEKMGQTLTQEPD